MMMKNNIAVGKAISRIICLLFTVGILFILTTSQTHALGTIESNLTGDEEEQTYIDEPGSAETPEDLRELNITNDLSIRYTSDNGTIAGPLRILLILTAIALAPILIICLTSFTRILIVMHFTRAALNTQTAPPNQILIGLSLFLTFFIMSPTITTIYQDAIVPFEAGELTQEEALETGLAPLRTFMYGQTQVKDVNMFMEIAGQEWDSSAENAAEQVPTYVLIPSFMVSELRTAFIIGFLIYIPFIIIDMVVASTLMSMGMMMLPPTTISMPFKILLFVLADGWNLIIVNLVKTFY